jgi:hypothetical protein
VDGYEPNLHSPIILVKLSNLVEICLVVEVKDVH